jgi:F-type H+-transporting ATPase subunit b
MKRMRNMTKETSWLASVACAAMLVFASVAMGAEPAGEHGAGHAEPQLIGGLSAGVIPALTTLVVFVVLLIVLSKFAWGPIASGLKAREDKIRRDIEEAEAARKRAEAALAQYNQQLATAEEQVREILAKAAADAERIGTSMRMKAQQEAEEIKEKAQRDIETARAQAVREFHAEAATLATAVAEKILRRNLNVEDQRALVNSSLEQLQSLNRN